MDVMGQEEEYGETQGVTASPRKEGRTPRRVWGKFVIFVLIILFAAFALVYVTRSSGALSGVNPRGWQSVFLTNGQVYFGHLRSAGKNYAALSNIFYIQAIQPLQQGAETPPPPTLSLIKLGGELHGPEDIMYLSHQNILFWENMKDDAEVVKKIREFYERQRSGQ